MLAAHHLGREQVDRARRGDEGGGGERRRRPHEGAQVAGVGQAVGVDDEQDRVAGARGERSSPSGGGSRDREDGHDRAGVSRVESLSATRCVTG